MLREILKYLDDNAADAETIEAVWWIAFEWFKKAKQGTAIRPMRKALHDAYVEGRHDAVDALLGDMTGGIDY